MQNQQLHAHWQIDQSTATQNLKPEEKVVDVELLSASEQRTFSGSTPSRLLYIFKTNCPACSATLPIWKQLAVEAQAPVENKLAFGLED